MEVLIQTEEAGINQKFNTELSKLMDPNALLGGEPRGTPPNLLAGHTPFEGGPLSTDPLIYREVSYKQRFVPVQLPGQLNNDHTFASR